MRDQSLWEVVAGLLRVLVEVVLPMEATRTSAQTRDSAEMSNLLLLLRQEQVNVRGPGPMQGHPADHEISKRSHYTSCDEDI